MKISLTQQFRDRLISGLRKKTINSCSHWAQTYRMMPNGLWSFDRFPWLKEPHDSQHEMNIAQKGAQIGFTELLLNIVFYYVDILKNDVLYVLPNQVPDASNFSASRFNLAVEMSPHLSELFSTNNVGQKISGINSVYIRGSQSRAGLKSIPVAFVVLDEVEEMDEANVTLALERTSGQMERKAWMVSTPHIPGKGINKYFLDSTQEHFCFTCPSCGRWTELVYPDCLWIPESVTSPTDPEIYKSHYHCKECKNTLPHETKTEWLKTGKYIPMMSNKTHRGFTVSQMYSTTVKPHQLASLALKAESNPSDATEFYNSKLGMTYIDKGAQVTDQNLEDCKKSHRNDDEPQPHGKVITMGIDVGPKWNHFVILEWTVKNTLDVSSDSRPRLIHHGKAHSFDHLSKLMHKYQVKFAVIDAQPERRMAYNFAMQFIGYVRMCFYGNSVQGKQIHINVSEQGEPTVTVDRTSWLDLTLSRFKNKGIDLPNDIDHEYCKHIKASVRIYGKDKNDNPVGQYTKADNDEDHYAHAQNYAEIALPMAVAVGKHKDLGRIL